MLSLALRNTFSAVRWCTKRLIPYVVLMLIQYVLINIIYKHSTMLRNFDQVVMYVVGSLLASVRRGLQWVHVLSQ